MVSGTRKSEKFWGEIRSSRVWNSSPWRMSFGRCEQFVELQHPKLEKKKISTFQLPVCDFGRFPWRLNRKCGLVHKPYERLLRRASCESHLITIGITSQISSRTDASTANSIADITRTGSPRIRFIKITFSDLLKWRKCVSAPFPLLYAASTESSAVPYSLAFSTSTSTSETLSSSMGTDTGDETTAGNFNPTAIILAFLGVGLVASITIGALGCRRGIGRVAASQQRNEGEREPVLGTPRVNLQDRPKLWELWTNVAADGRNWGLISSTEVPWGSMMVSICMKKVIITNPIVCQPIAVSLPQNGPISPLLQQNTPQTISMSRPSRWITFLNPLIHIQYLRDTLGHEGSTGRRIVSDSRKQLRDCEVVVAIAMPARGDIYEYSLGVSYDHDLWASILAESVRQSSTYVLSIKSNQVTFKFNKSRLNHFKTSHPVSPLCFN